LIKEQFMAYSPRELIAIQQAWATAPDWWGADALLGTARPDTLTFTGGGHLILGLAGNDSITVRGVYDSLGNGIFGGAGNDVISAWEDQNFVSVDSGDDNIQIGRFRLDNDNNHNTVLGGSGNDYVYVVGRQNTVSGGAGNDRLNVLERRR
jgi:Ca2+-binding RTX toxin-like protein